MRVFVIGPSGSGKTPFSLCLAPLLGSQHVRAGAWVREKFQNASFASRDEENAALTQYALGELRKDPATAIKYLRSKHQLANAVIDGIRNPYDFMHLFDTRTDTVIFLKNTNARVQPTLFEDGISIIRSYACYLEENGFVKAEQVQEVFHSGLNPGVYGSSFDMLAKACAEIIFKADLPTIESEIQTALTFPNVYWSLGGIPSFVDASFLYDGDASYAGQHEPCDIVELTCYPGFVPTFTVLLADGSVFSDMPPHAFREEVSPSVLYGLQDLVYHNCPDVAVAYTVHSFEVLRDAPVSAYLRRIDEWVSGTYLFTVDWYGSNDLLHAIRLEAGQIAFLPNHKVKFGGGNFFKPYLKMHQEWRV